MTLLIGSFTIGLILSLLAMGVFISFRVFHVADITAEGSITLGAAVAATALVAGINPLLATAFGFLGGMVAGATTGILHTKFKIHSLLSGILVMTALYSINLHVMGKSNVPLVSQTTLSSYAEALGQSLGRGAVSFTVFGWEVSLHDASILIFMLLVCVFIGVALYLFFRTNLGTAMRATGDNDQMIRAMGVNVSNMIILGLAISNGMIALCGRAACAVSRFRRRADGHRHGRMGPGQRHYRELTCGYREFGTCGCRHRDGIRTLPAACGHRVALGFESQ